MKKLIYISGVVLVNLFVIGTVCKLLHFPGASIFILTSLVLFVTALLPMALINNYRNNGKEKSSLYIAAYCTASLVLIAALFKIFHWPGASWLMMIATPLPFALFLPVFLYHNRKHEPKQSLNFIGVMLLLVYVAVFSSLLALNVSKNVIDGLYITASDFSSAARTYDQKNVSDYEALGVTHKGVLPADVAELKKRTDAICQKIDEVKSRLVSTIDGDKAPALESNGQVNFSKVISKTETNTTSFIMHGNSSSGGEANVLKEMVSSYRSFLIGLTTDKEVQKLIDAILNTAPAPSATDPGETDPWEWQMFPANAYLITILGNLSAVQYNIRIAEFCLLQQYQ